MTFVSCSQHGRRAFTLIEMLVVITIIGILAALVLPVYQSVVTKSHQLTTLSNMRQVGAAFLLYAGDNNGQLPARVTGTSDKWPKLLSTYVQNLKAYNSPIPTYVGTQYQVTDPTLLVSSSANNTDYIANGYNDINDISNSNPPAPRLNLISNPSQVILMGIPLPGKNNFYMDFSEGAGNNNDVLDKQPWPNGSVYIFSDGSSRFLKYRSTDDMTQPPISSDYYSDWLWLINKSSTVIKGPPGH